MKIRAQILRELLISTIFSSCFVAIVTKIFVLDDFNQHGGIDRKYNPRFSFSSLLPFEFSSSSRAETIHVGMIVKNVWRPSPGSLKFKMQFVVVLRSILKNANSTQNPIHFLLMVDQPSVPYLQPIVEKFIRRDVIERNQTFQVTYDFFNLNAIANNFRDEIQTLRPFFTSTSEQARKYMDNLFMIAPFYHRVLPFEKFIMLDIDLKFRIDIFELFKLFDQFTDEQMIGVGPDLAPHYRIAFREYRAKNPGTRVGEPGPMQGFNTGVVLYDLEKMRRNIDFNFYVDNKNNKTSNLANSYFYSSHLGDQCFFTLLGMGHPDWFYNLPCGYNYQLDTSMYCAETAEFFHLYHTCDDEPKIYHGNGGTEIPRDFELSEGTWQESNDKE